MTQSSPTIGANKSGLTYRQEDNDGKKALLNHHKGSSAPSYAEAGIVWLDDAATPWILKIYDGADWIKIADVNASTNAVTPYLGTVPLKLLGYASDTGSANAYTVAPVPAISAYSGGQMVLLKPGNTNTGSSTLAISGLTAASIKMPDGSNTPAGVLKTSGVYLLVHNGTNFTVLNPTMEAGVVVDRAYSSYTTNAAVTTVIPNDDTLPQNTEGAQILTASITPKMTTNRVRVRFSGFGSLSTGGYVTAALFLNSDADAAQVTTMFCSTANAIQQLTLEFEHVPGATSAQTYKLRIGPSVGTARMNGISSARYFGGAAAATLVIEEISA